MREALFPDSEFKRRLSVIQAEMDRRGHSALILTTPADIFYVSGFLTRFWESPTRPWFVVVPASGMPIAVIPSIGEHLMKRTWLSDIRTWNAPDPRDDGVGLLSDTICSLAPTSGQVGLPMGPETQLRMPLADFNRVVRNISPRELVDGTDVIRHAREVKSDLEVDKIRTICQIASNAFDVVPDLICKSTTMDRLFRDFQVALLDAGADWVSYVAGGAGPDGYEDVISPAGNIPLVAGDIVMLDTGAVKDGYFCDFDRNFAIERTSKAARRAHSALFAATEHALESIRAGMRACDAYDVLYDKLRAEGAKPAPGRFGHGVGLSLTEWPSLDAHDQTELREHMILALEPAVEVVPGYHLVHEENVVLRDTGPELLSRRAPEELPIVPT